VRALVVEAPHVFCEDISIRSIRATKEAYEQGDLRERLARYHDEVDNAFYGWNDAWLLPEFRQWNIEDYLPGISCPLFAIQGADDAYGTLAQLDAIERRVTGSFERLVLAQCGHSPHREQEAATLAAMAGFIVRV
jgi:pimeloyl-ACP methyl ester carboxylesterase